VRTKQDEQVEQALIRNKQVALAKGIADRIALMYPLHTLSLHLGRGNFPASVIVKVLPKKDEAQLHRQDSFCEQVEISVHSPLEKWPHGKASEAIRDSRPHQVSLRSSVRDNFGAVYKIRSDLSFSDKLLGKVFEYINEQMDVFAAREVHRRAIEKTEDTVAKIVKALGHMAAEVETVCYPDGMVEVTLRTADWLTCLPARRIWPGEIGPYIVASNRYINAIRLLGRSREEEGQVP
jgi:hypothetical protein